MKVHQDEPENSRFHINEHQYAKSGSTFPDLSCSPNWFNIKLFPLGIDPMQPISYDAHRKAFTRAKAKAGIVSSKVTHLGRGSGAQAAELGGASEDNIRRAGRWEQGSMAKCYLSQLPRESMRVLAGFPAEIGSYWIARDILVPEKLLNLVFPETKVWLQRYNAQDDCEQTMCLGGFLRLLQQLRSVFIQDSVMLRKKYPDHFVFQHQLFSTQAYVQYEHLFCSTLAEQPSPADLTIRMAMPLMEEKVTSGFASVIQGIDHLRNQMRVVTKITSLTGDIVTDVYDGKVPITLKAQWPEDKYGSLSSILKDCREAPPLDSIHNAQKNTLNTLNTLSRENPTQGPPVSLSPLAQLQQMLNPHAIVQKSIDQSSQHIYRFPDSLPSAAEHWREYNDGLLGQAPMRTMYDHSAHKWTGTDSEKLRKRFERRMYIVNTIKSIAARYSQPEDAVARRIDEICKAKKPAVSMYKLREECRKKCFEYVPRN